MVAGQMEEWGERVDSDLGMDMYTLLYLQWMTSKDLLYSTGNCSMFCGSLEGREIWGRVDTCICMAESLCCPTETITTLSISYTLIQKKV